MKTMNKLIAAASMALFTLTGCQQEQFDDSWESGNYSASVETFGIDTRTALNEQNYVEWCAKDRIAVFQGCSLADIFEVTEASAGKPNGTFRMVRADGGDDFVSGTEIADNVAVYPYSDKLECVNDRLADGEVVAYRIYNVEYPSLQYYSEDSFADDSFVMVAVTDGTKDRNLRFKNVSGAIRLRVKGRTSVSLITIKGHNGEHLSGYATVRAYKDGSAPIVESFPGHSETISLYCRNGVQLNETVPTEFILALPPTVFEKGFTVTIKDVNDVISEHSTDKRNTVSRSGILNMPEITFGVPGGSSVGDVTDLNANGETANSYIISEVGTYRFDAVKGNSSTSVGSVSKVEVLWESFGTSVTPSVGDLVKSVSYSGGYIQFSTADTFREGNAVIAAKDASGTILWSWHIWLTDLPQGQVYYNNAGTMMDRNLGATSASPGDVGALGLLYQWGRKDPFLGSSNISSSTVAKSTGSWPSAVSSSSSKGTIDYAVKNPMTFITYNSQNYDWYYTGSSSTDNTRWQSAKTIYDPCPSGWRVPDGGSEGVWSKALGSSFPFSYTYNDAKEGMNFSGKFGSASTIWYPASGYRNFGDGSLNSVGNRGYYWSASPDSNDAYGLYFSYGGGVFPSHYDHRAYGQAVRCLQEGSFTPPADTPKEYEDLSVEGTANSYIISESGDYKFETVKGNSSTSVGSVSKVEVLWESFGTSVTPSVGDLVKSVSYSGGYIQFSTADTFREGNAVIAAKDASGNILWSWHIWFTDQPQGQVYYNNAGTMMDRNLGATSATPGEVGALGLLYQWGRKDPFLGSSSISDEVDAKSTVSWPSAVSSSSSKGTIDYAVKNPMTFITYNSQNYDWCYTGSSSTDNTRWQSAKTIYDPCPVGWRVPDGGDNGVWSKALGSSSSFGYTYNDAKEGMNFSGKFGSASTIWYPASGCRYNSNGSLNSVGFLGDYWSASPNSYYACRLLFYYNGLVSPSSYNDRANGQTVRCVKE